MTSSLIQGSRTNCFYKKVVIGSSPIANFSRTASSEFSVKTSTVKVCCCADSWLRSSHRWKLWTSRGAWKTTSLLRKLPDLSRWFPLLMTWQCSKTCLMFSVLANNSWTSEVVITKSMQSSLLTSSSTLIILRIQEDTQTILSLEKLIQKATPSTSWENLQAHAKTIQSNCGTR